MKGKVQYIAKNARIMIVADEPFPGGHEGAGGCEQYCFPKLPRYKGRCYWVEASGVVLADIVVAKAEGEVSL